MVQLVEKDSGLALKKGREGGAEEQRTTVRGTSGEADKPVAGMSQDKIGHLNSQSNP